MDAALKAQVEEKAAELRAATQDRNISPADLEGAIDALQQALFSIGSQLYQQSDTDEDEDGVDFDVDVPTTVMEGGLSEEQFLEEEAVADETDIDGDSIDLDATITADYEAID